MQGKRVWIRGDIFSVDAMECLEGKPRIIITNPDARKMVLTMLVEHGHSIVEIDKALKGGGTAVITPSEWASFMFIHKLKNPQSKLSHINVVLYGIERQIFDKPYQQVNLFWLPELSQERVARENVANAVFSESVRMLKENSKALSAISVNDEDIIFQEAYVKHWCDWWVGVCSGKKIPVESTLSYIMELASSFFYVVNIYKEEDYELLDNKVVNYKNHKGYPFIKQALEFRHGIAFSSFQSSEIIVSFLDLINEVNSLVVFSEAKPINHEFDYIDGENLDVNVEAWLSTSAMISGLSSCAIKGSAVFTKSPDKFEDTHNVFDNFYDINGFEKVYIDATDLTMLDINHILRRFSVIGQRAVLCLNDSMFEDGFRLKAMALIAGSIEKNTGKILELFSTMQAKKLAKNRSTALQYDTFVKPQYQSIIKLLNFDVNISNQSAVNGFLKVYVNQLKQVSSLQSKSVLNLSFQDL